VGGGVVRQQIVIWSAAGQLRGGDRGRRCRGRGLFCRTPDLVCSLSILLFFSINFHFSRFI